MQSRRDVLRTGAGLATAGGIASLAGCSNVPIVGSYFEDGVDPTEWAYDPSELDLEMVWANVRDVSMLLEEDGVSNKGDIRDNATDNYGGELMADDVEYVLDVGSPYNPAEVVTGSFDGDEIVENLDLSSEDSYGDFSVYADENAESDGDALIATDGDVLVKTLSGNYTATDPREELELLLDTSSGDVDGFVDVNDDFQRVYDETGTGPLMSYYGQTESSTENADDDTTVANGTVAEIDGEELSSTQNRLYKHEDGIDLEEIESELEENMDDNAELNDVSQDGRLVTIEVTSPTEDVEF